MLEHGHARRSGYSATYNIYRHMLLRCYTKTSGGYKTTGARGIQVCQRWRDSYLDFLADMGERPPGRSLDRINVNGHYEPGNCRWATASQQQRNKTNSRLITWQGETMALADWADRLGMSRITLRSRLDHWSLARAMTEPLSDKHRRHARKPEVSHG